MATSETDIANKAIRFLGKGKTIEDIDTDTSAEGVAVREFYDQARDYLLGKCAWRWAHKIQALELVDEFDGDPLSEEFAYSYRKPTDCIRHSRILSGAMQDTRDGVIVYRESRDDQGGLIYTDTEDAYIEYTFREEDVSRYPAEFEFALAYYLAMLIAPSILGEGAYRIKPDLEREYKKHLSWAMALEGSQGRRPEQNESEFTRQR